MTKFIFDTVSTINPNIREKMFQLRKSVFCDSLGWKIPHCSGQEADIYDFTQSYYMNSIDPQTGALISSVRLIPFMCDNLMTTVFTQSHRCERSALMRQDNRIWEGTRLCINEGIIPVEERSSAMASLLMGLFQSCKAVGIEKLMCNCDSAMFRLYRSLKLKIEKLGSTDEFQHGVVHCIVFEISSYNRRILSNLADRSGIEWPEIEGAGIQSARSFTGAAETDSKATDLPILPAPYMASFESALLATQPRLADSAL